MSTVWQSVSLWLSFGHYQCLCVKPRGCVCDRVCIVSAMTDCRCAMSGQLGEASNTPSFTQSWSPSDHSLTVSISFCSLLKGHYTPLKKQPKDHFGCNKTQDDSVHWKKILEHFSHCVLKKIWLQGCPVSSSFQLLNGQTHMIQIIMNTGNVKDGCKTSRMVRPQNSGTPAKWSETEAYQICIPPAPTSPTLLLSNFL